MNEVQNFAERKGLKIDKYYKDIVSGKCKSDERMLGRLLSKLREGDVLIVTEVSRLSRTLIDIMNIINVCIEKKVVLHCTKEGYTFENNINSKILGFAFGLVAEIERNLISIRTKEALAVRKANGIILGRPQGTRPKRRILEENGEEIIRMIDDKIPYRTIAKKYEVSVCTLNRFLKSFRALEQIT